MNSASQQEVLDACVQPELTDDVNQIAEQIATSSAPHFAKGLEGFYKQLANFANIQESLKPTVEALQKVGREISRAGLAYVRMRLQRRRIDLKSIRIRWMQSLRALPRWLQELKVHEVSKLLSRVRYAIQPIISPSPFVHQVYSSCSVMPTGPPALSTEVPKLFLVTTWGREV
jgi:hypothetical protein